MLPNQMKLNGWHANLLFFPEGTMGNGTGRDKMVHVQFFQGGASFYEGGEKYLDTDSLIEQLAPFAPYVDHVAHAGLAWDRVKSQGTFSMALQPLPYISTRQFDQGGYLYARVPVN